MWQARSSKQLGRRDARGKFPADKAHDIQVMVNDEVLEADVMLAKGKVRSWLKRRTDRTALENAARGATLPPINARVCRFSKGGEVIPVISGSTWCRGVF